MGAVNPADHVGLVYSIADAYAKRTGQPREELIQEGAIGLTVAAKKFDPARGIKFSGFAYWWIHAAIGRYLNTRSQLVALPVLQMQARRKAHDLPPSPQSFDAPIATDQEGQATLHDVLADERASNPEIEAATIEERRIIWREVGKMPSRTRTILRMRFIFGNTLEEIGRALGGISRERVRQIEAQALATLRKQLEGALT